MSGPASKVPIHLQSSQNRLLIKNGRIVNHDQIFDADIFIENGIIAQIGPKLQVPGGVRIIDAAPSSPDSINYILPGGIDTHTHLEAEFMGAKTCDDYYNGSKAAIAGGTTTILNFIMPRHKDESLLDIYERELKLAQGKSCCDFAFHVCIASWIEGRTERELEKLVREYRVNSFKVFLCYSMALNDLQLIKVLETCGRIGGVVIAHCESGDIIEFNSRKLLASGVTGPEGHLLSRPECIEAEATQRVAVLAHQVQCPLLVAHVMSKSAAEVIARERLNNPCLFGETLAASISSDGSNYFNQCWQHAAAHVMSPPLRTETGTRETLLGALAADSIQVLGSDHCTFNSDQKKAGKDDFRRIPNGVNGIEERMMVAWERGVRGGYLDPCRFVAVTSTNAARIFNLYPRKGRIQVGSDADLVVWGACTRKISSKTHQSKCDFNIFEGQVVNSGPVFVVASGRVVFDQTGLHVSEGSGRLLERHSFPVAAYGPLRIKNRLMPVPVDRSRVVEVEKSAKQASESTPASRTNIESNIVPSKSSENQISSALETLHIDPNANLSKPGQVTSNIGLSSTGSGDLNDGFHMRTSSHGVKNMQDSTFKLTGEQLDDKTNRTNIRVSGQPPGGKTSGLW